MNCRLAQIFVGLTAPVLIAATLGAAHSAVADGNPSPGEALYQAHCAACHDNPGGRIPSRETISANPPLLIFNTLATGVMSSEAQGLSQTEMATLARYLSKYKNGDEARRTVPDPPRCAAVPPSLSLAVPGWNGWGNDVHNNRYQRQPGLSADDVRHLKVKWAIAMAGSRDGQPTVVGGRLFTNDTAGVVYSLDAQSGCVYWRFNAGAGTRTTITVGKLESGIYALYFAGRDHYVYALNAETGALLWKTLADDHRAVQMTGSPTFYDSKLYVPVSSAEEYLATFANYPCCTFRGSVVAMDGATGKVLWKTYTTAKAPEPTGKTADGVTQFGPAGGAIWSAPTVDEKRRLIYVGTGNSYTKTPYDGSDAVMALDMDSGAVRWMNQFDPKDDYVMDCYPGEHGSPNCPPEVGGDYDVGASPILHDLPDGRQILLVGQKSSQVYGMDPDDHGKIEWTTRLSAGGPLGGVEFGPAADTDTLYVAIADIYMRKYARPGLTALRIVDGKILWQMPGTQQPCRWKNQFCDAAQSQAVTAIPDVVFSGAMNGHLRAYSTKDGAILWDFNTAGETYHTLNGVDANGGVLDGGGPTVANGMLYVDSGYWGRSGDTGTVLLAFSPDGK